MSEYRLVMKGVVKTFPGVKALDHAQLELRPGKVMALMGENGAGKSTLIKVLSGLYPPTSGDVRVQGHPLGTPEATQAMAFIHQDLGLVEAMSVAENVALGTTYARSGGLISWRQVRRRAEEALALVELDVDPETLIADLTRADRSLVAIARALAMQPKVMLFDEPTSALDPEMVNEVLRGTEEPERPWLRHDLRLAPARRGVCHLRFGDRVS